MYVESALLPVLDGFGAMTADYMQSQASSNLPSAKISTPFLVKPPCPTCPSCSPIADVVCPDSLPCPDCAIEKSTLMTVPETGVVRWWWLLVAGFGGFAAGAGIASVMRKKA